MSVAALVKRVEELLKQAEAQETDHTPRITSSIARWQTMLAEMEKTRDDLQAKTREVAPIWQDDAGELYGRRLGRSSASVDAWTQQLSSAGIPAQLEALNQAIATTAQQLRTLHQEAKTLEQEYNQLQAELSAGVTPARAQYIIQRLAQIRARMMAIVAEAEGLIRTLSGEFARVGSLIAGAPNGTPWDGPATSSGPGTTSTPSTGGPAAPTAAPAGSPAAAPAAAPAGASAAPGGAPSGTTGGAPTGAPVAGGAPAPTLPGDPVTAASSPVVPPMAVPPSSIPASTPPSIPASTPAASGGVPYIAPIGALGAGLARVTPVSGNTGGTSQAAPPGVAPVPPGTVGASGTGSGGGGAGMGRMGVPPPVVPPRGGGGSGTSGGSKPGDDDPRYRDRSPRSVPGVPPRLRGRSGRLDAPPEFLGTGAGRAAQRDAETADEATEPLVEELWQVDEQTPVVEPPNIRRGLR